MRSFALVLLLLGGCSWVTARSSNEPRVSCSRTPGRVDAVVALGGVGILVGAIGYRISNPSGPDGDHGNHGLEAGVWATLGVAIALVEVIQANYGLRVADRCEAERAKLTMTVAPGSL